MNSVHHHPNEDILLSYHKGDLPFAHSIVIGAHIENCQHCQREISLLEEIGAAYFDNENEVALEDNALELALARIERPCEAAPIFKKPEYFGDLKVPEIVKSLGIKKRYWAAPGVWIAPIDIETEKEGMAYFMYAKKGLEMPRHMHDGMEFTHVLFGSLSDQSGEYHEGDFMSAEGDYDHSPLIGSNTDCLCLIATEKPIRPLSLIGKILQPFARI